MKKWFITLLTVISLTGCTLVKTMEKDSSSSSGSSEDKTEETESGHSSETSEGEDVEKDSDLIKDPDFSYRTINSIGDVTLDDFFNIHNMVSVVIDVDEEEMQKIQEDNYVGKKPEIYRLAKHVSITLTNNYQDFMWEFEDVGIRQKGNLSRENIFNGDDLNPHNHYKLSFDETFDDDYYDSEFVTAHGNQEYKDREFLGLSGLDFKWNRNEDSTHIKEIYASYLYQSAGIITQKVGLANLTIKVGEKFTDFGLCFMYEPTSKSIIKRKFSDNTNYINVPTWKEENKGTFGVSGKKYGDYYKVTYGQGDGYSFWGGGDLSDDSITDNRVGIKDDVYGRYWPAYERKTNTDEEYNEALIKDMVHTINSGNYSAISEKVDLEYFAIEEAVSYFLGNPDSFRYNYNNYMMYFRRTDGKMMVLPIDNDRTFGIGHTWDKGVTFGADVNTTPLSNRDVSGDENRNNLFKKTLLTNSNNECKTTFLKYVNAIAHSKWVDNETFVTFYNAAREAYSDRSFSLNGGSDNMSFENYIAIKLQSINK